MTTTRTALALSLAASALVGCAGSSNRNATADLLPDGGPVEKSDAGPTRVLDRCPGIPLKESGARDFDLQAVKLSGKVTLNGLPLPAENLQLVFTNETSELSTTVPVETTEGLPYRVTLTPGKYTISFAPGTCTDKTKLPCVGGALKKGADVHQDGVLDLDIPAVSLQGNVTLNGATFATAESELGRVRFVDAGGKYAAAVPLLRTTTSQPAKYAIVLLPGKYQPVYEGRSACSKTSQVPCNAGPIGAVIDATSNGVLDFDVETAKVEGAVTFSGSIPVTASYWGSIAMVPPVAPSIVADPKKPALTSAAIFPIDVTTKTPRYSGVVVRGTYDATYFGVASACQGASTSATPCNSGVVKENLALTANGVVDLDVPTVTVLGMVTANGAPPVDEANGIGSIQFASSKSKKTDLDEGTSLGGAFAVPIGADGVSAQYHATLVAGTYDVGYVGVTSRCATLTSAKKAILPCNSGIVKSGVVLTSAGTLDVDVHVARVTGLVQMDGKAMPDGKSDRGVLNFVPVDLTRSSAAASTTLGITGIPDYAVALFPGEYTVSYQPTASSVDPFPRNGGAIHEATTLDKDGTLDVGFETIQLTGLVTLDQAVFPKTDLDRGSISFLVKKGGVAIPDDSFGLAGSASYDLRILKGNYVVTYVSNHGLCDGADASMLPCIDSFLAGCDLPAK